SGRADHKTRPQQGVNTAQKKGRSKRPSGALGKMVGCLQGKTWGEWRQSLNEALTGTRNCGSW
ncbi:MAG: hypothetical protein ACLFV8_14905, partial [Alphaproteobacteria bacterium]